MDDHAPRIDAATIGGNASQALKQSLVDLVTEPDKATSTGPGRGIRARRAGFQPEIVSQVVWTEFSIVPKAEEPGRPEGRVVGEITVQEDMVNGLGMIHGACSALLIDVCSCMPIALLNLATRHRPDLGVSQSLNIVYHAPAIMDDRLRIVSTSIAVGSQTMSSRCEIWNVSRHRLVASGVHTRVISPSTSNAPSKL